ncbi:hypothetical protein P3L10_019974 [Capsicum annuum]
MKKLPFFLILLVVIISQHVHSQQTPELMRFVLQWPPTFCMQLNHAAQPSRCTEPILQHNLTLHGLWPSNANGYPISCHNKTNLDWRQVAILQRLERPNFRNFGQSLREREKTEKGVDWSLWKHEWSKHGACVGAETIAGAIVYFDTTIKINAMIRKGNFGGFVYLKEVTLCTDFFGTSFLSCPPKPDEGIKTCSVTGAKIRLPLPKPQKILEEVTGGIYPMFE